MFVASSRIVEMVDEAFLWIGGISLVLLVGITLMMFLFVIRYGRKRHPKAARISGNTALEITWIVIPTLIVLFMFWKGYEGFALMRNVPPDAMEIDVEAHQWYWTFRYPDADVSVNNHLYVPAGRAIKLNLTSPADGVLHSFYLPAFRVKEDCVPGRENHLWFREDRPLEDGEEERTYRIFCAEYCGTGHSKMNALLHVRRPQDFERWLDEKVAHRFRPAVLEEVMDPASEGIRDGNAPALYETLCASCHGREGEGGLVGGARSFRSLEGWKNAFTVPGIVRTLTLGLEGTQMRSFPSLSAWDRFALSWHVTRFYPGGDRPEATREEFERVIAEFELDKQREVKREFPIDETMRRMAEEAEEADGR